MATRAYEPTPGVLQPLPPCQGAAARELGYAGQLVSALAERWWMLVVRGAAATLFGVLAIVVPENLLALVILWAAYAVVDGVFAAMLAARRGRAGQRWGWLLFEGVAGIAAGVLALVWPGITALALLAVIAVWAVSTGIAKIAAAMRVRRWLSGERLLATSGVLSIAFGVLLPLSPGSGAPALAWMIGAYAIVFGALLIGLGLRLERWRRTGERPIPAAEATTTS